MHFIYESATYDRKKCSFKGRAYSWLGEVAIKSPLKNGVKGVVKNVSELVLMKPVLVKTGNGERSFYTGIP